MGLRWSVFDSQGQIPHVPPQVTQKKKPWPNSIKNKTYDKKKKK